MWKAMSCVCRIAGGLKIELRSKISQVPRRDRKIVMKVNLMSCSYMNNCQMVFKNP
jgi:hypothetical protein